MLERALMYVVTWEATDCASLYRAGSSCRVVNLVTAEPIGGLEAGVPVYTFVVPGTAPVARSWFPATRRFPDLRSLDVVTGRSHRV